MNNVNKTLYIPLYGKAFVSKKGIFLNDKKAEEIWEAEGFMQADFQKCSIGFTNIKGIKRRRAHADLLYNYVCRRRGLLRP